MMLIQIKVGVSFSFLFFAFWMTLINQLLGFPVKNSSYNRNKVKFSFGQQVSSLWK